MRIASVGAVCVVSCAASAGPLSPPAGPIAETYKTLDEVEPRIPVGPDTTPGDSGATYIIAAPGSYYLTGNVTGASGKIGIEINAENVHLDLSGYTLQGVPGSLQGVLVSVDGAHVKNGIVTDWGDTGVDISAFNSTVEGVLSSGNGVHGFDLSANVRVTDCKAVGNSLSGFYSNSNGVQYTNCQATSNSGGAGFSQGTRCVYIGCVAQGNRDGGFNVGEENVFTRCVATDNAFYSGATGAGFTAIGSSSSFDSCIAANNNGDGFSAGGTFTGCSAEDNAEFGYQLGPNSTVTTSKSFSNDQGGISISNYSTINGSASRSDAFFGIDAEVGCVVENCVVYASTGRGIDVSTGTVVRGCSASTNGDHGIFASNECLITDCAVNGNAQSGVYGSDNCIVRNTTASNNTSIGIRIGAGSMVSGCSAAGNATGISTGDRCFVDSCNVRSNSANGIYANHYCRITNNTCTLNSNGGAGANIRTNFGGRVEGNTCTEGGIGIQVDGARNAVVRNDLILNGSNIANPGGSTLPPSSGPGTAVDNDNIAH